MSTAPAKIELVTRETEHKHRSLWGDVWRQFRKHRLAMFGVIVFGLIIAA
ncbi:MAG: hypothetical protein KDE51_28485, partial [Anaerolineales bacterium]|nr:hypothetical protein [Anaerolineales bacterium]